MSYNVSMSGTVGNTPTPVTDAAALMQSLDLAFKATYDAAYAGSGSINGTSEAPFIPTLGQQITAYRAFAIRAVDGQSLLVKLSSGPGGADQVIPVSDLFLVRAQNAGDQFTVIKVIGQGRIEYLIAGNLA